MKNVTFNKWIDYEYNTNNNLISNNLITIAINALFKEFNSLSEANYNETFIMIQFKIKLINDQ